MQQTPYEFKQIFWQTWRDLVFVHWEVDPATLASRLPPQLEPDLFHGKAYVGLVPFRMTDIRHKYLPVIPGTSQTLETNVRTYVKRRGVPSEPIPAVWFFSLEAESALAVLVARFGFGLPYHKANMSFERQNSSDGRYWMTARSTRKWPPPLPGESLVEVEYSTEVTSAPTTPGTLEHFLMERYALYAVKRGRLVYGQVNHDPYRVVPGRLLKVNPQLLEAAGLPAPAPDSRALVHRADDVVVRIGKAVVV
jgi:uncharacterized protein YqjF (DUF2071 family)